jgi:hypothetical protein
MYQHIKGDKADENKHCSPIEAIGEEGVKNITTNNHIISQCKIHNLSTREKERKNQSEGAINDGIEEEISNVH